MSLACGEFKFKIHKPCCSGQWSRTNTNSIMATVIVNVLILIVVDDGLVLRRKLETFFLVLQCLNPCCNGQWSRT